MLKILYSRETLEFESSTFVARNVCGSAGEQFLNAFTALHVFFYRLSAGRVGGRFRGAPVLLLTTIGRKTAKRRTTPLLYITEGKGWVVVASNGGSPDGSLVVVEPEKES